LPVIAATSSAPSRPALGSESVKWIGVKVLKDLYAELRRCGQRCRNGEPAVDRRTGMPHECREVRHRRRPGRPRVGEEHDCAASGCQVIEFLRHRCKPMQASTIRQIHAILSAVLGAGAAILRPGYQPTYFDPHALLGR
jgi:hypothetical protein